MSPARRVETAGPPNDPNGRRPEALVVPSADFQVLSAMIAPALFMTATGSLIISTNNRLARIMDRIRVVIRQIEDLMTPPTSIALPELRHKYLDEELTNLRRRAHRIRLAAALLYLSFSMFVSSSLTIGLDAFLPIRLPYIPTALAFAGVVSLFLATANLFRETRTAMATLDHQLQFLSEWRRERLKDTGEK